jgi:hypothetical protein
MVTRKKTTLDPPSKLGKLKNIYDSYPRTNKYISKSEYEKLVQEGSIGEDDYFPINHPKYGLIYRDETERNKWNKEVDFVNSKANSILDLAQYKTLSQYVDNPFEWKKLNKLPSNYTPNTAINENNVLNLYDPSLIIPERNETFINNQGDLTEFCRQYPRHNTCVPGGKTYDPNTDNVFNQFSLTDNERTQIIRSVRAKNRPTDDYSDNTPEEQNEIKKLFVEKVDQKYKNNPEYQKLKRQQELASLPTLNSRGILGDETYSPRIFTNNLIPYVDRTEFAFNLMQADSEFALNGDISLEENLKNYQLQKEKDFDKLRKSGAGKKESSNFDNLNSEYKEQFIPAETQAQRIERNKAILAELNNKNATESQPKFRKIRGFDSQDIEPIKEPPFTLNRSQPISIGQRPQLMGKPQDEEPAVVPTPPVTPTQPVPPVVSQPSVPQAVAAPLPLPIPPVSPVPSATNTVPFTPRTTPYYPLATPISTENVSIPELPIGATPRSQLGYNPNPPPFYPQEFRSPVTGRNVSFQNYQGNNLPDMQLNSLNPKLIPGLNLEDRVPEVQIPEAKPKQSLYSPQDWVIAGLMGANAITGRQSALRQEQNQANLMREMGQRPTYYAGYYDNAARTTIGRNQGLITASHGALIPSTETGLENALVERGEYLVYPDGKFREVGGEKHSAKVVNGKEVGGTETILPEGTMVFSQKLNVPGTKKSFANMAKSLSGKIEDYMEKMNKVGIAKVDKDTAELMFNRTVKSLNELFELQQSVNGNHGEDYVDTVDPETGEGGEMPVAGNGMIKYGNAGLVGEEPTTSTKQGKKTKVQPPDNMYEIWQRIEKEDNAEIKAAFTDLLKREGIDIKDEAAFKGAVNINKFLIGLDKYEKLIEDESTASDWMDRNKGNQKRINAIARYLESDSFKTLKLSPDEIPLFKSGVITKKGDKYIVDKSKIKKIEDFLDPDNVGKYQGIYRGLIRFNDNYGKNNPKYEYNYTPTGVPDQTMNGKPISPVDKFLGNTTIDQTGKRVFVYPEYEEPESKEPPVTQTDPTGSTYTQATPVRPSKYTGRPYDIKQAIPNVLAMSQEVAPYVIPEVQDIRVSPYETYIDPAVQDQYSAAMAASSYGADPNAMFINATQNVMKMQAEKRNQDANIDYQTRMQNANFERQADQLNANRLDAVNNNLLNVAKSNKAELDINSMQNMIQNYAKYQANEAATAMKFPLVSPSADYNANSMEYTVIPEYQRAMMNFNPSLLNQEGFFIPDASQIATATKEKSSKKDSGTDWEAQAKKLQQENNLLKSYFNSPTK